MTQNCMHFTFIFSLPTKTESLQGLKVPQLFLSSLHFSEREVRECRCIVQDNAHPVHAWSRTLSLASLMSTELIYNCFLRIWKCWQLLTDCILTAKLWSQLPEQIGQMKQLAVRSPGSAVGRQAVSLTSNGWGLHMEGLRAQTQWLAQKHWDSESPWAWNRKKHGMLMGVFTWKTVTS